MGTEELRQSLFTPLHGFQWIFKPAINVLMSPQCLGLKHFFTRQNKKQQQQQLYEPKDCKTCDLSVVVDSPTTFNQAANHFWHLSVVFNLYFSFSPS